MQLLNSHIIEHVTIDGTNYILSAGTSDVNSGAVDCANCEEVTFLLAIGVMAASSSVDVKVQESADGSTGWADLTGTALTQVSATDDDKLVGISIRNPLKQYLRLAITRGDGGNSTLQSLIAIKGPARKQNAASTLQSTGTGQFASAPEQHVSPVAGTA